MCSIAEEGRNALCTSSGGRSASRATGAIASPPLTRPAAFADAATVRSMTQSHDSVVQATTATARTMRSQRVPVNVYETRGALVVVSPLPAVTAQDVTIELRPGTLRFWAHLRSAPPREYLTHEWEYGGYEREVDVPEGYGAGLEASLANGQLAIRVLRGASGPSVTVKPTPL